MEKVFYLFVFFISFLGDLHAQIPSITDIVDALAIVIEPEFQKNCSNPLPEDFGVKRDNALAQCAAVIFKNRAVGENVGKICLAFNEGILINTNDYCLNSLLMMALDKVGKDLASRKQEINRRAANDFVKDVLNKKTDVVKETPSTSTPQTGKQTPKLRLEVETSTPDLNGVVVFTIHTNAYTNSLKVNGEEQGGRPYGNYVVKKVARVGQDTDFVITATDTNGNTDSTTITVARKSVSQSPNQFSVLKPEGIKRSSTRDAVAIIIGIQNYKRVPKAEFANSDAKDFYEYAIRAFGIKPENIKLLLDEDADDVNIVKAFENWLPLQVNKGKTDVYVFYSGHGLPSTDGQSLYFLPYGVDKDLLSRTAIGQKEVVAALIASKPKSVTMFIDSCYSGQTRGGETLLASAKPLTLKAIANVYPSNFTVITASSNDQISSSSVELKHGIFSFYLMKGMEGDADGNKDGKITAGEMQDYLSDKVSRQAMSMNRKQDTQLIGEPNKVLLTKQPISPQ
ncbi:Caspase domain containing protein [Oxalobacteraceae bacterium]